jgi:hypothetical protein
MAKPPPPEHSRFKKGQSGNPGGKPVGTRNAIQGSFLKKLQEDFDKFGALAIRQCRKKDPTGYVRVVASLMPKELEIKSPLDHLSDEQLSAAIAALQSFVAAQGDAAGAIAPQEPAKTH